jgi:hypothetical protein
MNKKSKIETPVKDTDNYEGLMLNSNEEFKLLVNNKAVQSFSRAEAASKPVKLDLLLTKLYLAL